MKKKIFCLILSLCMIYSCTVPALATNGKDASASKNLLTADILSKTQSVLAFMEPEQSLYGLDGVDFSTLYLGEQIPAYIVESSGAVAETDTLYFPVMSGNDWVATAVVTRDSAGKTNVQISTSYAKIYTENCEGEDIALVFDSEAAYILAEGNLVQAAAAPGAVPERRWTDQHRIDTTTLRTVSLEAKTAVGVPSTRSYGVQHFLTVPCIQQDPNFYQCWAACIASILGYYDQPTTIQEVYTETQRNICDRLGANFDESVDAMEAFGYTGLKKYRHPAGLSWHDLRLDISLYQAPLYAHCVHPSSQNNSDDDDIHPGHAVVLRGFYVYEYVDQVGIISYMNPASGEYESSSVATDGEYYYVPHNSSVPYEMTNFWRIQNP